MKTKIIKSEGWYRLAVQDAEINAKYGCTNKDPIILGIITEFFSSGCWGAQDYRNKQHLIPSPYMEEGVQEYLPKNEEEKEKILSLLHSREVDESGVVYWPLFDSYLFDGDNPSHKDKRGEEYSSVARFTFKEAFKRLQEQKVFWESFDKKDLTLDEVRIENPSRQQRASEILMDVF